MTMEGKLKYFEEVIAREVEARKRRAKHQLANDLSKSAAVAIEAAEDKVNSRVEAARRDLMRKANKKIATATAEAKAAYITSRNIQQSKLLDDVLEKLKLFTQSAEYESYLIERINSVKAMQEFTVVKLRPKDIFFAEAIQKATGLMPLAGENDYIGGFILHSENGKVQADYTFKERISQFEKAGVI